MLSNRILLLMMRSLTYITSLHVETSARLYCAEKLLPYISFVVFVGGVKLLIQYALKTRLNLYYVTAFSAFIQDKNVICYLPPNAKVRSILACILNEVGKGIKLFNVHLIIRVHNMSVFQTLSNTSNTFVTLQWLLILIEN